MYVENDLDYAGLKQSIQQLAQAKPVKMILLNPLMLSMMEDVFNWA